MAKEKGKETIYWTNEEPVIIKVNGREHIEMQPTANSLCIIDGKGFGVTKDGFNYCAGPVRDVATDRHQTTQGVKNSVAKIPQIENHRGDNIHEQNDGIMQHRKRGRPLKPAGEKLHRSTIFRRKQKELQGVLL